MIVYRFAFKLPAETVQTGYGTLWPDAPYGLKDYLQMAGEAGFDVESRSTHEHALSLDLLKKV